MPINIRRVRGLTALLCIASSFHPSFARAAPPVAGERIEKLESVFKDIRKDSARERKLVGGLFSQAAAFGAFITVGLQASKLAEDEAISHAFLGSAALAVSGLWILGGANRSETGSMFFEQDREYSVEGVQRTVQFGESALQDIASRAAFERTVDGILLMSAGAYNISLGTQAKTSPVRDQTGSSGVALTFVGSAWSLRERRFFGSGLVAMAGLGNLIANLWQRGNPAEQYYIYSGSLWIAAGLWNLFIPRIEEIESERYMGWSTSFVPLPGGAFVQARTTFR